MKQIKNKIAIENETDIFMEILLKRYYVQEIKIEIKTKEGTILSAKAKNKFEKEQCDENCKFDSEM